MANLFSSIGNKKPVKCKHKNRITRVLSVLVTCEKTAVFCIDCGTQLTKSKQDCR